MRRLIFDLAIVLLLGNTFAFGGESNQRDDRTSAFDDPTGKAVGNGFSNQVVLEAGDADAKVTGRLAGVFSKHNPNYGRYRVSITAPFDSKKAEKVDVGTLSGLSAGTSLAAEFGWMRWAIASDDDWNALKALCEEAIPKIIAGYKWDLVNDNSSAICAVATFSEGGLEGVVKELKDARAACEKQPANERPRKCNDLLEAGVPKLHADIEKILPRTIHSMREAEQAVLKPIRTVTLGGKANQQKFNYVLATDPATKIEQDNAGYGATLAYTEIDRGMLWTVGFSNETIRKGGDKVQVCNPIGATGSSSCFESAIGAPETKHASIGFAETRWLMNAKHFALSPRVEFDFKLSDWAVRLPMYFVTNAKGQLTAGVALGYTSEKRDFAASVFIGKAFSFIEQ